MALVLIGILLVISLFIIANTIKLATFYRREEIAIMKMGVVNIDQHLVLALQVAQGVVQVHRQQGEGAHDNQAGHNHAHRGKGHKAVGKRILKRWPRPRRPWSRCPA